jgi:hypothetical protein
MCDWNELKIFQQTHNEEDLVNDEDGEGHLGRVAEQAVGLAANRFELDRLEVVGDWDQNLEVKLNGK